MPLPTPSLPAVSTLPRILPQHPGLLKPRIVPLPPSTTALKQLIAHGIRSVGRRELGLLTESFTEGGSASAGKSAGTTTSQSGHGGAAPFRPSSRPQGQRQSNLPHSHSSPSSPSSSSTVVPLSSDGCSLGPGSSCNAGAARCPRISVIATTPATDPPTSLSSPSSPLSSTSTKASFSLDTTAPTRPPSKCPSKPAPLLIPAPPPPPSPTATATIRQAVHAIIGHLDHIPEIRKLNSLPRGAKQNRLARLFTLVSRVSVAEACGLAGPYLGFGNGDDASTRVCPGADDTQNWHFECNTAGYGCGRLKDQRSQRADRRKGRRPHRKNGNGGGRVRHRAHQSKTTPHLGVTTSSAEAPSLSRSHSAVSITSVLSVSTVSSSLSSSTSSSPSSATATPTAPDNSYIAVSIVRKNKEWQYPIDVRAVCSRCERAWFRMTVLRGDMRDILRCEADKIRAEGRARNESKEKKVDSAAEEVRPASGSRVEQADEKEDIKQEIVGTPLSPVSESGETVTSNSAPDPAASSTPPIPKIVISPPVTSPPSASTPLALSTSSAKPPPHPLRSHPVIRPDGSHPDPLQWASPRPPRSYAHNSHPTLPDSQAHSRPQLLPPPLLSHRAETQSEPPSPSGSQPQSSSQWVPFPRSRSLYSIRSHSRRPSRARSFRSLSLHSIRSSDSGPGTNTHSHSHSHSLPSLSSISVHARQAIAAAQAAAHHRKQLIQLQADRVLDFWAARGGFESVHTFRDSVCFWVGKVEVAAVGMGGCGGVGSIGDRNVDTNSSSDTVVNPSGEVNAWVDVGVDVDTDGTVVAVHEPPAGPSPLRIKLSTKLTRPRALTPILRLGLSTQQVNKAVRRYRRDYLVRTCPVHGVKKKGQEAKKAERGCGRKLEGRDGKSNDASGPAWKWKWKSMLCGMTEMEGGSKKEKKKKDEERTKGVKKGKEKGREEDKHRSDDEEFSVQKQEELKKRTRISSNKGNTKIEDRSEEKGFIATTTANTIQKECKCRLGRQSRLRIAFAASAAAASDFYFSHLCLWRTKRAAERRRWKRKWKNDNLVEW